jgi:hypothetical protein
VAHQRQHKEKADRGSGSGQAAAGSMRLSGVLWIHHDIEAARVFSIKTQSPSTLEWRLGVEVRRTCRFEITARLGTPADLMDPAAAGPLPVSSHLLLG